MKLVEFVVNKDFADPLYVIPYNALELDVFESKDEYVITFFKPERDDFNWQVGHD